VLNNTHEYLKYLLGQEKWTSEEMEWMLNYLDRGDLSELEAVAGASFNADVAFLEKGSGSPYPARVLEKLHQGIDASRPFGVIKGRWYKITLAAAALVALIAGAGYFFRLLSRDRTAGRHAMAQADRAPDVAPGGGTMREAVTALRERKTIPLPDGTQVSLEQGSTLDYPDRFSDKTREIYLNGEAFFEVKKEEGRPFIVHSRFLRITVLGTSFNVDTNGADEERVVVVSGSVKVQVSGEGNAEQALVVAPNQRAVYYALPDRLEKQEASEDALFYQQRRNGSFVYNGITVKKVIGDMQRFYHTKLILDGDGLNCIFHGHFHTYDELDKALSLVAIPLNARVRKDTTANAYVIYGGSCQ
jgi:ferric-dicitrate binding protein FerR (iron transport regulator)